MNVRVKICGITSVDDAKAAADAGADAIGLNFYAESPRFVGDRYEQIAAAVPPSVQVVGVFVDAPVEQIQRVSKVAEIVQLHGHEEPSILASLPWPIFVLRAIRVRSAQDLAELDRWNVPGFLLDGAGRPGAHGGATFDWSLFLEAKKRTQKPLILAGGLTPENVAEAVRITQPFGVDVASGVESAPGRKDWKRMAEFVRNAKGIS